MNFRILPLLLSLLFTAPARAQGSFTIPRGSQVLILTSDSLPSPALKAVEMLSADLMRTLSAKAVTGNTPLPLPTISVSLSPQSFPQGTHEAYRLSTAEGILSIEGSDALGTAYGVLQLSRWLGVSPWEWWAETEIEPLESFSLTLPQPTVEAPYVEHRGIFINDEDFSLAPWATRFDSSQATDRWPNVIGPEVTERICQLLLRLKADTYMPAMHDGTRPFFLTPGNATVARSYGIFISTSHCEPMACNTNGEWKERGQGDYNFASNREAVLSFWQERLDEVASQPTIFTIGMRGVHDDPMHGASSDIERRDLLEQVFAAQQSMLRKTLAPDAYEQALQVFIPYKEVLDAVNAGLSIPPEAAVIQCDDNYGFIRWPSDSMLARPAGTGLYYHVSYWGRPHDYLWLSTTHPRLMQEELTRFALAGRQRLWTLNVGDIKPAEYQTPLFMAIAWGPRP